MMRKTNNNNKTLLDENNRKNDAIKKQSSPSSFLRTARRFLAGYVLAGVASTLLTTIFGLLHVDVFLRIYQLPLTSYATGNLIFSIINTANDLAGAWLVDSMNMASNYQRSDIVGISGVLFALCFTTPFFRFSSMSNDSVWASVHFVTTLSLYDTMYSFVAILLGSIVTDNHVMSEEDRVWFLACGKGFNMVASLVVARVGLAMLDHSSFDMSRFRIFVVVLSVVTSVMFVTAQTLMTDKKDDKRALWRAFLPNKRKNDTLQSTLDGNDDLNDGSRNAASGNDGKRSRQSKLRLGRVVCAFWNHKNFCAWVGMEMLLECQFNFMTSFVKTFVDRLVLHKTGFFTKTNCDTFLSMLRPCTQVASILAYVPIRKIGYKRLYQIMMMTNLVLATLCLWLGSPSSTWLIVSFIAVYTVVTGAISSAGFHLAMSDMVLESKVQSFHTNQPSLAGLYMGANALLCKPMDALLPILAAMFLKTTNFQQQQQQNSSIESEWVLFYLLLGPPCVFSCLQLLSWSRYNLDSKRVKELRNQLKQLQHDDATEAEALL